jgi:hypothetical protein
VFSDSDDDEEDNENPAAPNSQWFNKRERFKDTLWGVKMWDMVQNFGFRQLPDGTCEVYHHGEYFKGSAPPFSLLVRGVFQVHARWVAWAAEHHIKHHAFSAEGGRELTEEEEAIEEASRRDMPLHLVTHHIVPDLKAMLDFGPAPTKTRAPSQQRDDEGCSGEPSFLTKGAAEESAEASRSWEAHAEKIKATVAVDIAEDRKVEEQLVTLRRRASVAELKPEDTFEASSVAVMNDPTVYQHATKAALSRKETRLVVRRSSRKAVEGGEGV